MVKGLLDGGRGSIWGVIKDPNLHENLAKKKTRRIARKLMEKSVETVVHQG